ncbi:hypothetical protein CTI12_AA151670 [Artemisia annua]|uniref:Uncharacterized protein n=1 Tax=Artemisia annua TaxID=35608 RepID=A0A2U1PHN2_ARTAN|nr:hypothetical protein CTI12_AA151670 [Artemisia annua]
MDCLLPGVLHRNVLITEEIPGSMDKLFFSKMSNSLKEKGSKNILARQLVMLTQKIANLQSSRAQMRGIATNTQAMLQNSLGVGGAVDHLRGGIRQGAA